MIYFGTDFCKNLMYFRSKTMEFQSMGKWVFEICFNFRSETQTLIFFKKSNV